MKRALIVFGSTTGTTTEVAHWVADRLAASGFDVTIQDCTDALVQGLFPPYNLVVLGCPSYDNQPNDVQKEFESLLDNLERSGIAGKKVAVFGCGNSQYPRFCAAVDIVDERVRACGGRLIVPSLKVDAPYLVFRKDVEAWAVRAAAA